MTSDSGIGCLGLIALAVGLFLLNAWIFHAGWTRVAVEAFGAPALTYAQSMWAVVLLSIATGGLRWSSKRGDK